jgi:hypothetical protein
VQKQYPQQQQVCEKQPTLQIGCSSQAFHADQSMTQLGDRETVE